MKYAVFNSKLVLLVLLISVLTACSTPSITAPPGNNEIHYVASVDIDSSMSQAELEAMYGGQTVVFKPEAGFAVLGFGKEQGELSTLTTSENQNMLGAPVVGAQGNSAWAAGSSAWASGWSSWAAGYSSWASGFSSWASGYSSWASGWSAWAGGLPELPEESHKKLKKIKVREAQVAAKNLGYGVKVALLDTGLDLSHPMFAGRLAPEAEWKDFIDGDNYPQDGNGFGGGHGTAVAGLILQIAPMTTIMPLRVLDQDGMGDTDDIIAAIDWAVQNGADIINTSLGTDVYIPALEAMVQYAASKGVYIIASVGNEGNAKPTYPAAWGTSPNFGDFVVSVGSVDEFEAESDFSNGGAEFYAPGEAIISSFSGEQTATVSGTSFAAPQITGALALAMGDTADEYEDILEDLLEKSAKSIGHGKGLIDVVGLITSLPDYEGRGVLFVAGSTSLNTADTALRQRLESLGFEVKVVDDGASKTSDAAEASVVIISSTVNAGSVGDKFRDVSRPVITWEDYLYDNMKMTAYSDDDDGPRYYGTSSGQRNINVLAGHALSAGLSGGIQAYTSSSYMTWGLPSSSASNVGNISVYIDYDDLRTAAFTSSSAIFAYEKDSQMIGMTAPARRIGFFLDNDTATKLTEEGWQLFDAAVLWAASSGNGDAMPPSGSSGGSTQTLEVRVSQSSDDAEERNSNGYMYRNSSDLELISDGSRSQTVGVRFQNLNIPQGATITSAYIEFETDETNSGSTSLSIRGQDSDTTSTFSSSSYNISSRPATSASVNWSNLSAWSQVSQKHQSPDLSKIVQEIVDRGGWSSGNSMVFIITGSGERTAESYDGESSNAPLLHVEYRE